MDKLSGWKTGSGVYTIYTFITQTCLCDMQRLLKAVKMIFLNFAQNIDCG